MKKFSSLGKHSISRIDTNRKPLFMLTKSPKVVIQPWSSTSNLSKSTKQIIDTPTLYTSNINPWKDYKASNIVQSFSFETSECSQEVEKRSDFENVYSSDNININPNDSPHSDTCQLQCHHTMCHLTLPETSLIKATATKNRSPKFLAKRHRSMKLSKKKGIQWKQIVKTNRKNRTDNISMIKKSLSYSRSSPNLKLEEIPQNSKNNISDDDTSSSCKEE